MLVKFFVENFRSFKDEVCLDLSAAKSRKKKDHLLVENRGRVTTTVPLVVAYGSNAAGKSNLVRALKVAQSIVTVGVGPGQPIPVEPFALDPAWRARPTRFDFMFKVDGILYTYGFVADTRRVVEEWLFGYFTSRESRLFERRTTDAGRVEVEMGPRLLAEEKEPGFIRFVAEGTRPNQLFLTECIQRNVTFLSPVYSWFRDSLQVVAPGMGIGSLPTQLLSGEDFLDFASAYVKVADTGLSGLRIAKKERLDLADAGKEIPPELAPVVEFFRRNLVAAKKSFLVLSGSPPTLLFHDPSEGESPGNCWLVHLEGQHQGADGQVVNLPFNEESDGTQRLFHLTAALSELRSQERVFVIDELDRSLHPLLCRHFVETFLGLVREFKTRGQLIVTTHQTSLLSEELVRRDEVCFVEKDVGGATHLTTLAEYRVSGGLNYERGYLSGRFGAIPFLGDPGQLVR